METTLLLSIPPVTNVLVKQQLRSETVPISRLVKTYGPITRRGLGQIELFVTFLLVCFLLVLAVLYLGKNRSVSLRTRCEMQQIQVARALLTDEAIRNRFAGYRDWRVGTEPGEASTNWAISCLPHLYPAGASTPSPTANGGPQDQGEVAPAKELWGKGPFADVAGTLPLDGENPERTPELARMAAEFACPADTTKHENAASGNISYVVNCGQPDAEAAHDLPPDWAANGVFQNRTLFGKQLARPNSLQSIEAADGTNHALLLSENIDAGRFDSGAESLLGFVWVPELANSTTDRVDTPLRMNQWAGKSDGSLRFARPSSFHPGGVIVVYVSGRSQFLNDSIDPVILARLMITDSEHVRIAGQALPLGPPYGLALEKTDKGD